MNQPKNRTVYVGTYADAANAGIYVYELDINSGELLVKGSVSQIVNPSFLAKDSAHHRLLAVSEAAPTPGEIVVYDVHPTTYLLTKRSSTSTEGAAPCHVSLIPADAAHPERPQSLAVVANYNGGNVALFSIDTDGRVQLEQSIPHHGHSINRDRQMQPHPHSAIVATGSKYVYVQDLGTDEVVIYKLHRDEKRLELQNRVKLTPGSGPRHLTFHPSRNEAYLIHELDSTITVLLVESEGASLIPLETYTTLPEGYTGTSWAADVHVSPDGRYLYASNRGHDSIAVFRIDDVPSTTTATANTASSALSATPLSSGTPPETGTSTARLTLQGHVSTEGEYPRNFALTPDGKMMLVANQLTDSIVTYWLNTETGMPVPTGHVTHVPHPVCIVF